jgi:hypothetical protein
LKKQSDLAEQELKPGLYPQKPLKRQHYICPVFTIKESTALGIKVFIRLLACPFFRLFSPFLIYNRERSGLSPDMAEGYQEELSSSCPYKVL